MKRSRSGARPPGGTKQLAKHHARYNYALMVFHADGTITEPTESELDVFRGRHPEVAQKLDEAGSSGLAAGSWQEKCFLILDGITKQKRAVWFRAPVDPVKERLPDYFTVVKQPMDLSSCLSLPLARRRRRFARAHARRTRMCSSSHATVAACARRLAAQARSRHACWAIITPTIRALRWTCASPSRTR